MPITINLDVMLAKRKMRSKELAEAIGITEPNLSILKNGRAKAIRFSTLCSICEVMGCQPGDILVYDTEVSDLSSDMTTAPRSNTLEHEDAHKNALTSDTEQ